jgi:hypothetical protein
MSNPKKPTPLALETRAALPTAEAAHHLNRANQTLRIWAMTGEGPLKPLRINGRLAWPVADIKALVGVV